MNLEKLFKYYKTDKSTHQYHRIYDSYLSKLRNKNCDWIIVNDVSKKGIGFESDYNEVIIHYKTPRHKKDKLSFKKKSEISEEIVDRIVNLMN